MANNYQQFSILLDIKKLDVVKKMLDILERLEDDSDYDEDSAGGEDIVSDGWISAMGDAVGENGGIGSLSIDNGESLWAYAEECGNLDALAEVLQVLLNHEAIAGNHDKGVLITWANTCSKMRPDEFSGGAMLVTKNAVYWQPDAYRWANEVEEYTDVEG